MKICWVGAKLFHLDRYVDGWGHRYVDGWGHRYVDGWGHRYDKDKSYLFFMCVASVV
jgi:hypothetical protein